MLLKLQGNTMTHILGEGLGEIDVFVWMAGAVLLEAQNA